MDDLESKLGEILSNPQMMQQIMGLAQSLGQPSEKPGANAPPSGMNALPSIPDLAALQTISGVLSQSNMDAQQQNLLRALTPYLNQERIRKLEKAMRAAKLAKMASAFLENGGIQLLTGR